MGARPRLATLDSDGHPPAIYRTYVALTSVAPAPVIFMHTDATDMRKSFTGLCGIIRGVFGDDPANGSLFLFVNK